MEKRLLEFDNIMKENDDIYRCAARSLGLSDSAFWILYAFRMEKEELTLREICNVLYQPKQTVHSALKKMEKDGYIQTEGEMEDRRSKRLSLTAKGKRLAEETVDRVIDLECKALSGMSMEEQRSFMGLFHKYTLLLKENMKELNEKKEEE